MNSERPFLFVSGILFFLFPLLPLAVSDSPLVNVIFNASMMFGGICFMVSAFER